VIRNALFIVVVIGLAACGGGGGNGAVGGGGGGSPSGVITLSAGGTSPVSTSQSDPLVSSAASTTFTASEVGYAGTFTEQIAAQSGSVLGGNLATCFTLTQGAFTFSVNANGLLCIGGTNDGSSAAIRVSDSLGNWALLYFQRN
jgi:hypothetical protein